MERKEERSNLFESSFGLWFQRNANARLALCQGPDTPCMVFQMGSLKYGANALYLYASNFNSSSTHVSNELWEYAIPSTTIAKRSNIRSGSVGFSFTISKERAKDYVKWSPKGEDESEMKRDSLMNWGTCSLLHFALWSIPKRTPYAPIVSSHAHSIRDWIK